MKNKKYQFILWRRWKGLTFFRLNPDETDLASVYDWILLLGWLEIRKWKLRLVEGGKVTCLWCGAKGEKMRKLKGSPICSKCYKEYRGTLEK